MELDEEVIMRKKREAKKTYGKTARGASSPGRMRKEEREINEDTHQQLEKISEISDKMSERDSQPALHMPEPLSMTCLGGEIG